MVLAVSRALSRGVIVELNFFTLIANVCSFHVALQLRMTAIDHQVVLDCIARKLREVERLMIDTADCITAKILLEECKVNLDRIAPLISQAIFNPIDDSITGLISICNSQPPGVNLQLDTGYRAERPLTGLFCSQCFSVLNCVEVHELCSRL